MGDPGRRVGLMRLMRRSCGFMGRGMRRSLLHAAALRLARRTGKLGIARRGRLGIIKARELAALDLFSEDALDASDHVLVFTRDECEGIAGLRGPAGAADPVRVCVGGIGHVVVDDV